MLKNCLVFLPIWRFVQKPKVLRYVENELHRNKHKRNLKQFLESGLSMHNAFVTVDERAVPCDRGIDEITPISGINEVSVTWVVL